MLEDSGILFKSCFTRKPSCLGLLWLSRLSLWGLFLLTVFFLKPLPCYFDLFNQSNAAWMCLRKQKGFPQSRPLGVLDETRQFRVFREEGGFLGQTCWGRISLPSASQLLSVSGQRQELLGS